MTTTLPPDSTPAPDSSSAPAGPKPDAITVNLHNIPMLRGLDPETMSFVARSLTVKRVGKGVHVLHKGGPGDHLLFLLAGRLQVVDITMEGKEIGLSFIEPGDYFGELSIIDDLPRSASIVACEVSLIALLPRPQAQALIYKNPLVAERVLKRMTASLRASSNYRAILGLPNAFQRVYALLQQFTITAPGGLVVIEKLPTQQEMAIMVNTSRETVSRAVQGLIQRGIVEKTCAASSCASRPSCWRRPMVKRWRDRLEPLAETPMKVAFGSTILVQALKRDAVDGIGSYSRELWQRLSTLENTALLPYVFASGEAASPLGRTLGLGPFAWQALFAQFSGMAFPLASHRLPVDIDLVHATDHLIPVLRRTPVIATLMDAIPLAHPEWVSLRLRQLKNLMWCQAARKARRVLTISEHARSEIVEWFGIPEARISVTPLGVDQRWFMPPSEAECQRVSRTLHLPPAYFLFLGTLQPRKNLMTLIKAHRALPLAMRQAFPLVVAGRAGWSCGAEVSALREGDSGMLRWLNFVPDRDLVPLVHGARALIFPSLHEGFGLPVLEAFAARTPVICSNTSSLPEVAGDAALLIQPEDAGQMAEAMLQVIDNGALTERLLDRGLLRARQFTWERTAALTRQAYQEALS